MIYYNKLHFILKKFAVDFSPRLPQWKLSHWQYFSYIVAVGAGRWCHLV